jgi:hypothetical protein
MAPCNPPLNFVSNGAPGSAFPPPLDPTPPSFGPPSPTFEESACSLLGPDLCGGMDPISAIDELSALVDSIDALTTAADANLDAILLELDQLGQDQVSKAFDDFTGAQPGATSLLAGVEGIAAPQLGTLALVQPDGSAPVIFGGPPEQGGAAHAGAAPYIYHLKLALVNQGVQNIDADGGDGPDPPFAGFGPVVIETGADGKEYWVYHVTINPKTPGTFIGQAKSLWHVTITGITGTIQRTNNFQVVIQ